MRRQARDECGTQIVPHLDRYVTEQVFRYNNRKMSDADRFDLAVKGMVGKRLTYAEVTGKTAKAIN